MIVVRTPVDQVVQLTPPERTRGLSSCSLGRLERLGRLLLETDALQLNTVVAAVAAAAAAGDGGRKHCRGRCGVGVVESGGRGMEIIIMTRDDVHEIIARLLLSGGVGVVGVGVVDSVHDRWNTAIDGVAVLRKRLYTVGMDGWPLGRFTETLPEILAHR